MKIYRQKKRWKWYLFATGLLIVTSSLWYTNYLVQKIAANERNQLRIWADATQRKAQFVTYTESFFQELKLEEQKRVRLLAMATERMATSPANTDLTLFSKIIEENTTIPVILTDEEDNILSARNVNFDTKKIRRLDGEMKTEFTRYPPIPIEFLPGSTNYFYYTESRLFSELRQVLDDLIQTFFSEVVENSASVPVVITDASKKNVLNYGNIDSIEMRNPVYVANILRHMESENIPILLMLKDQGATYIYYQNSYLLTQLRYYPYFQLGIIAVFLFISYFLFSTSRRSEQNQVWAGMAKETAHQLGTPISSIMAWIELMKMREMDPETVTEMEKDVRRLNTIAARFSKIGSAPSLKEENVVHVIYDAVEYLRPRTSKNVKFSISPDRSEKISAPLSADLFEWVIENVCRNSIDAMSGSGEIHLDISQDEKWVILEITDTGKGIPRSAFKTVFKPGFTSKKRGWGLGLTLARRIIHEYHKGKIFVKSSVPGKGTTIRVLLRK